MSKHPTGHHGGGHHGAGHKQGNRGAPLDKRLNASSGKEESSMSQWNMAELKANLEDDSALLEQTLRTANKLLGETSGVQLVDVGGTVGEDGKRMLRENASGNSAAEGELARIKAGTWLTELTTKGVGREPQVLGSTLKLSEQLMLMISGLRDISPVAAMALEKVIKSDADQIRLLGRSHSRQGGKGQEHAASTISELEIRVVEEETMKLQALETNLHLQEDLTASQSSLGIAQDKLLTLEAGDGERSKMSKQMGEEVSRLSEELLASQHKSRQEETERIKLLEKMRRKEVEAGRFRESMDRMTLQMQSLGEERDFMQQQLEDAKGDCDDLQHQVDRMQRELHKVHSAERVMKRNLQLQIPDEVKKVLKRVDELEKQNRELIKKVDDHKAHTEGSTVVENLRTEVREKRISNKDLTNQNESLRTDKESLEKKAEGERRLLEGRTRNLFEQNIRSIHKLQSEQELRIAERLYNRSNDNEVASLRRKNLENVSAINKLEQAKDKAEAMSIDAEKRCKDLIQRLEIYATMHKLDIARLSVAPGLKPEDEVHFLIGAKTPAFGKHASQPPLSGQSSNESFPFTKETGQYRRTSSATVHEKDRIKGDGSLPSHSAHRPGTSMETTGWRKNSVPRHQTEPPPRPASTQPGSSTDLTVHPSVSPKYGAGAKGEDRRPGSAVAAEMQELKARQSTVMHRLGTEEKMRKHEQDRSASLAEKLAEKDKELGALMSQMAVLKEEQTRVKKGRKVALMESQITSLNNRLREAEMDKDQIQIRLQEKEEENRLKGRKISELLFRVQVGEENRNRVLDELADVKAQLTRTTEQVAKLRKRSRRSSSAFAETTDVLASPESRPGDSGTWGGDSRDSRRSSTRGSNRSYEGGSAENTRRGGSSGNTGGGSAGNTKGSAGEGRGSAGDRGGATRPYEEVVQADVGSIVSPLHRDTTSAEHTGGGGGRTGLGGVSPLQREAVPPASNSSGDSPVTYGAPPAALMERAVSPALSPAWEGGGSALPRPSTPVQRPRKSPDLDLQRVDASAAPSADLEGGGAGSEEEQEQDAF